jgi:hypothetical protein
MMAFRLHLAGIEGRVMVMIVYRFTWAKIDSWIMLDIYDGLLYITLCMGPMLTFW